MLGAVSCHDSIVINVRRRNPSGDIEPTPLDLEGSRAVVVVSVAEHLLDQEFAVLCLMGNNVLARSAGGVVMKKTGNMDRTNLVSRVDVVFSISKVAVVGHTREGEGALEVRRETSRSGLEQQNVLPYLEVGLLVLSVEGALGDGLGEVGSDEDSLLDSAQARVMLRDEVADCKLDVRRREGSSTRRTEGTLEVSVGSERSTGLSAMKDEVRAVTEGLADRRIDGVLKVKKEVAFVPMRRGLTTEGSHDSCCDGTETSLYHTLSARVMGNALNDLDTVVLAECLHLVVDEILGVVTSEDVGTSTEVREGVLETIGHVLGGDRGEVEEVNDARDALYDCHEMTLAVRHWAFAVDVPRVVNVRGKGGDQSTNGLWAMRSGLGELALHARGDVAISVAVHALPVDSRRPLEIEDRA
jgi:hypothetical protein